MAAFREYPKLLYYPDGRASAVETLAEETALIAAGWSLTPFNYTPGVYRIPASIRAVAAMYPNDKLRTLRLTNDSEEAAVIKWGPDAAFDDFSWPLDPGTAFEMPLVINRFGYHEPEYNGLITIIWESASGALQVSLTEFP